MDFKYQMERNLIVEKFGESMSVKASAIAVEAPVRAQRPSPRNSLIS